MRTWWVKPRIWMKLAAIALSFMIPLVVTTYFLVNEQNIKIDFAEQEIEGLRYLQPLSQLLVHVESHRALVRQANTDQAGRVEAVVDQDFSSLLAVDRDLAKSLKTTGAALNARKRGAAIPARLRASWESVKLA